MSLAAEEKRYRSLLQLDLSEGHALEALVRALYDESWRVRSAAAEQLARLPERERAVPMLLAALADRDQTGARNSAAEALVRLGSAAAPAIVRLLSHPDADQRRFAADILGGMRWREGVPSLIEALEDPDPNVRVSSGEALGRLGGEAAAEALQRKVSDPDPMVRLCAMEGLAEMRRPPPLAVLIPLLEDPKTRGTAYRLLGLIPQPDAAELICRGLLSELRSVREAAFAAVAAQRTLLEPAREGELQQLLRSVLSRSPSARELVASALSALDSQVRAGALLAASALGDPELAPSIAELARDDRLAEEVVRVLAQLGPRAGSKLLRSMDSLSAPAREAAAGALAEMADASHVEQLAQLAHSGDRQVQVSTIKALAHTQSAEAVPVVARFLDDEQLAPLAARALTSLATRFESLVRDRLEASIARRPTAAALFALSRTGAARSLSTLKRVFRTPDPQIRVASVDAAAELGPEAALEFSRLALADESPSVRCAGARALAKVSPTLSEPLLSQALQDPDAWVQAAALEVVGEIGAARLAPKLETLAASVDGLRAGRAIHALARLGLLSSELVEAALRHPDSEVVKEALLASAPKPEGAAVAHRLLSHSLWDVRAAAARVLAMAGRSDSIPQLQAALEREQDAMARQALVEALSALSHR